MEWSVNTKNQVVTLVLPLQGNCINTPIIFLKLELLTSTYPLQSRSLLN